MSKVFANRTARKDFVQNELTRLGSGKTNAYVAVAFFTEPGVVLDLLAQGCQVKMVVRLGFPTSPFALDAIRKHPNMQLRVFTGRSFHPKLYIFGDEVALVGSANLTRSAITTNQEVVVSIASDDERFDELACVFDEYWDQAEVPTEPQLKLYKELYARYERHEDAADLLAREAAEKLGNTAPRNIARGEAARSKQSVFLSTFRKTYQESVAAFDILREVYKEVGYRKVSEEKIPLRIEIDSFISFVRERAAAGDDWSSTPIRTRDEQRPIIRELVEQWSETPWPHFEQRIVGENYPRFKRVFDSERAIMDANDGDLFDALATLHSFHDRYRFFEGGLPTWKKYFPTRNDPAKVRSSLAELVHGGGDIVERMASQLFDESLSLNEFGRSNVQELVGWRNREDLPILNGRTTKVLRYFGSKVKQLA